MFKSFIILYPLSLCFLLNILIHQNILIGILNCINLGLLLIFYQNFADKKFPIISTPLFILLGSIPLFSYNYKDPTIIFFAIGLELLLFAYTKLKANTLFAVIIGIYLIIAALFAGQVIKFPFFFDTERLIFNDHNTNLAIKGMQNEAIYVPYKLRLIIFNISGYIPVIFSKIAELFMIKNLYDVLLIANIYPLFLGLVSELKNWNKQKSLIISAIFLISFIIVISRFVDIFPTFLLLSPFLFYFLLTGFKAINQKIYFLLYILSLLIFTSPLK